VIPLRRLRIGPAEFRDVGAVETAIDHADLLSCLADAGIIGASLMQEAIWQIDYGAQRLTIAASVEELDHVEDAIRLEFTPASDASPSPLVSLPAGEGTLTRLPTSMMVAGDGRVDVAVAPVEGFYDSLEEPGLGSGG